MIALIQRVSEAEVRVGSELVAAIDGADALATDAHLRLAHPLDEGNHE